MGARKRIDLPVGETAVAAAWALGLCCLGGGGQANQGAARPTSAPSVGRSASATRPATQPAPSAQGIRRLVAELGHDRYARRDAAMKALRTAGRPALPALLEAMKRDDPELSYRAAELVDAIRAGNREVHVVGLYEGCDAVHGHGRKRQAGTAELRVARKGKHLTIVLCSYEPVAWTVKIDPDVSVERVILSGYYDQSVAGLPKGARLVRTSYSSGDRDYFYAYRPGDEAYARMASAVRALTGLKIIGFQGTYRPQPGQVFRIDAK